MIRRPPRSTLFPYTDALPISHGGDGHRKPVVRFARVVADLHLERPLGGIAGCLIELACFTDPLVVGQRRSEEHTSELQSQSNLVCRLLLEKKKKKRQRDTDQR